MPAWSAATNGVAQAGQDSKEEGRRGTGLASPRCRELRPGDLVSEGEGGRVLVQSRERTDTKTCRLARRGETINERRKGRWWASECLRRREPEANQGEIYIPIST